VERLHDALAPAVVADGVPDLLHEAGQRGLCHDRVGPQRPEERLPRDDPVAVASQMQEQVQHLGLDRDFAAAVLQHPGRLVEPTVAEAEDHPRAPFALSPVGPSLSPNRSASDHEMIKVGGRRRG
jgi:hypothetical protein